MLIDYHLHSKYSADSSAEMSDIAASAVLHGISEIAITDHYDVAPSGMPNWSASYNPDEYFKEIKELQKMYDGELVIRSAIEIGNAYINPNEADNFINNYPYDYVLAAIHYSNGVWIVTEFNKVKNLSEFKKEYLENIESIIDWGNFDCLAHFDLPVRYDSNFNFDDFDEKVEQILNKLANFSGKGLELNLNSFQYNLQKPLPSKKILKMWHNAGGRIITIGTDSHYAKNAGKFAQEGQELLLECGFTGITTFEKRKPIMNQIEFIEWN